jgi:hypothetical protein
MFAILLSCIFFNSEVQAFNFPWSDSAKYRRECTKSCIEDSFGKAKALEINQRCSNKCGHLPLSPKDIWDAYDHCDSIQKKYQFFYQKYGAELATCDAEKDQKSLLCKKKYGPLPDGKQSSGYLPGQVYKDYLREEALEDCQRENNYSTSKQCHQLNLERISIGAPVECSKPRIQRPR